MKAADMPAVYTVILNWNNYKDTKNCLESLQRVTYPNLKVIVVDNASADGSGRRLQQEFPQHQFVFNEKNLGFSRGCNAGIRAALEDEACRYVLLLNNDAVVSPRLLEKAVEAAEASDDIGVVGGKIFHSADSKVLSYAGGYVSRWRGQTIVRGFAEVDQGRYDEPCEVGFIIGALMLIKRGVLETVGLLPEEYFFGVEDLDYSLTVRLKGYKLYYVPQFVAYHVGDGSHWTWNPKYVYNGYRGKLILLQKHLPFGLFPVWKFLLTLYAKFLAKRMWKRLANKYGYDKDREVIYEDMEFALIKAIQDHRKDDLSEETLVRFDEALKRRKKLVAE
ncbi:MAG: glycosyltransferase family 2 protein [Blastocatellia bacterium]